MKFCRFCGTPLEDNAICQCAEAQAEFSANNPQATPATPIQPAPAAPTPTVEQPAPVTQTTPVTPQPVQQPSVYTTQPAPTPAGDGKFVKALKNLPTTFVPYFKDSKSIVSKAKEEKDLISSLLYTIALFISLVIFGCCFFNKLDSSIGGITSMFGASGLVQTFNFGNILLHSLIMTFLIAGLYIFVRFALIKIFNKASDPKTIFIDSFIDFSVNSTPTIVLFVIGGILAFISYYIAIFAIILVLIFYITVLVRGAIENIPEMKNEGLFNIVTALFITIAIAIFTYVAYQMLIATALSTVSSTQSYLNNIGSSFLDGLFG